MVRDTRAAALALHRFGLGPRIGAIEAIASDPQRALMSELDQPLAGLVAAADLPSSGAANRAVFEFNAERTAKDKLARRRREAAQKLAENGSQNASMENEMAAHAEGPPAVGGGAGAGPGPGQIF